VHGYGAMLAIGFLLGMYLAQRDAKHFGISDKKLADMFPWIILGAAVGARLFHVLVERPAFVFEHPLDIFKLWDGGVTFYGGLIGGVIVVYLFTRKHKMSMLAVSDFIIPYAALGMVFGRLGCFLAGCCYGLPTELPWGIAIMNHDSITRPLGIALHPTQLYQALVNLITFIILYRNTWRKKFEGQNLLLFGLMYPLGRTIVEFFRADSIRGYIIDGVITTSQGISIVIFVTCLVIYINRIRHEKKN
ncbi:MAG: prolipoprotein diacylglyceryl transferase, partial [Pseudomonadota bacterium]